MVGYHNTLPFLHGLRAQADAYDLILDVPSECLSYFDRGEADVALVPIGALLVHDDHRVITDYCIGCVGAVETVCIYAHRPIGELDKIFLDSDSRTSQVLTKILCRNHWNIDVEFFAFAVWIARPDFPQSEISKLNEALSIGVEDLELVLSDHKALDQKVDLRTYFERYIEYHYDEQKKEAHSLYRKYWKVMQSELVEQ